jgi:glycosyltransferase involved in cell wall biosynthesis
MTAPLVSVLTPSFNQSRWLEENLRSVANQTYPHIEHIVMDGASTDGSVDILERAGRTVRWTSESDNGQSHALNKAFADSRGEIIGWLNSDDAYFRRDTVELVVRAFEEHPEAAIVYGHAALVNADGLLLHMVWVPRFSARLLRTHNFIIQPAAFIRRSAIASQFLDEAFQSAMDRELWLRLAPVQRFVRLGHVLATDRHHRDRKSVARKDLGRIDTARIVQAYPVPEGWSTQLRLKALKFAFRLAGVSLAGEAFRSLACEARPGGRTLLYIRQLFVVRALMPDGSITSTQVR